MSLISIHVHADIDGFGKKLDLILKKIHNMANTIKDLTEKVDALQASLDAEQLQIAKAIEDLNTVITDLRAAAEANGTEEERQALADKLDAIKTDLEGTIADEESPETPEA
jgi:uncharacterized coiled-coil DUF342 family protein